MKLVRPLRLTVTREPCQGADRSQQQRGQALRNLEGRARATNGGWFSRCFLEATEGEPAAARAPFPRAAVVLVAVAQRPA